jgi:hypothetical protein
VTLGVLDMINCCDMVALQLAVMFWHLGHGAKVELAAVTETKMVVGVLAGAPLELVATTAGTTKPEA